MKAHTKQHLVVFQCLLYLMFISYSLEAQNLTTVQKNQLQSPIDSTTLLNKTNMPDFFANPPLVYKPRPLWFWNNTTLTSAGIMDQMQKCRDICGYGGFGILPYGGFGLEPNGGANMPKYLEEEYFSLYDVAVKKANELGMKLCVYDEYGFPSGSVGAMLGDGIPRLMNKYPDATIKRLDKIEQIVIGPKIYTKTLPAGTLMSIVAMNTVSKERVDLTSTAASGTITWNAPEGSWRFMIFVCVKDGDPNVDYLDPDAIDKFIGMVHQSYYDRFKEYFGKTIDGVFYDEPTMYRAAGRMWTRNYNEKFQAKYGFSPTAYYPALWYDIGTETAAARNYLFGFRAELYASGLGKRTQDWCDAHGGISATGHQDAEDRANPVSISGDIMKCYKYQNIPGIDKIDGGTNRPAEKYYKLVSSVAYNWDKPLVMSETYGAMGNISWNEIYSIAMDQYAKGINKLIPHAVWYNTSHVVFPPELSYRNPIYATGLPKFNAFIGRLNVMLQNDGRHVSDIGVLYPISTLQGSHYLDGPQGAWAGGVAIPEGNYADLGETLFSQVCRDYTWIHPEVLDERCTVNGDTLKLNNTRNHEAFKVLIMPAQKTISWSNLQKIKQFYDHGGKVIAVGTLPSQSAEFGHDSDVVATISQMFPNCNNFSITASSQWADPGYEPNLAIDGSMTSRWNALSDGGNQWLQIDFGSEQTFNKTKISEAFNRITSYNIQYWDGSKWVNCFTGNTLGTSKVDTFATVKSSKVRLYINTVTELSPSIYEFAIYLNNGSDLVTSDTLKINHNSGEGRSVFLKLANADRLRNALDALVKVYDVEIEDGKQLRYIHKVKDSLDIYYFANIENVSFNGYVRLHGKITPTIWDPHTGKITKPIYTTLSEDGEEITRVKMTLSANHSCFIVTEIDSLLNDTKVIETDANTIEVYPNPANQLLTIHFGNDLYKKFNIINMTGKTVLSFDVPNQSIDMNIDVSGLSKGVYCLDLQGNNHLRGKLVVK